MQSMIRNLQTHCRKFRQMMKESHMHLHHPDQSAVWFFFVPKGQENNLTKVDSPIIKFAHSQGANTQRVQKMAC